MIRRMRRSLLGAIVLAALSASGYFFLTERPLVVPVVSVERNVPVRVYGLGTVEARIVSKVGFEAGAALTELAVDSGEPVAEGQVLARLTVLNSRRAWRGPRRRSRPQVQRSARPRPASTAPARS
jgi:HlyD family secretion protein